MRVYGIEGAIRSVRFDASASAAARLLLSDHAHINLCDSGLTTTIDVSVTVQRCCTMNTSVGYGPGCTVKSTRDIKHAKDHGDHSEQCVTESAT